MTSTSLDTIEQEGHSCLRRVRRRNERFCRFGARPKIHHFAQIIGASIALTRQ
jgi:hypothetical protein